MTRRLFAFAVFLSFARLAQAQELGAGDWVFLVDTSKSMQPFFAEVQESIKTFVQEANDGDSVAIFTFDRGAKMHTATEVKGKARDDLFKIVDDLEAEGNRTHLGLAIQKGLERAASLPPDKTRTKAVVLFTDGKQDVRGIKDAVPIESNLKRVGDSHIFFVSLDEHEQRLDLFDKATVLRTQNIREVAKEIRAKLPPKPQPPPPAPKVVVKPTPPPPPPPPEKPSYLGYIIALALLIGGALFAFARHRRNHRLEGELEIVSPRVAPDAAFVGLPRLEKTEVALSAILPLDALAGSDARLFVKRKNGEKHVWISARSGSLRINDIETPTSPLFDADTIRIGDATLRFNRAGFARPEEDQ
jgi:hypothetical protein